MRKKNYLFISIILCINTNSWSIDPNMYRALSYNIQCKYRDPLEAF
jgi:hypothetical protein